MRGDQVEAMHSSAKTCRVRDAEIKDDNRVPAPTDRLNADPISAFRTIQELLKLKTGKRVASGGKALLMPLVARAQLTRLTGSLEQSR